MACCAVFRRVGCDVLRCICIRGCYMSEWSTTLTPIRIIIVPILTAAVAKPLSTSLSDGCPAMTTRPRHHTFRMSQPTSFRLCPNLIPAGEFDAYTYRDIRRMRSQWNRLPSSANLHPCSRRKHHAWGQGALDSNWLLGRHMSR